MDIDLDKIEGLIKLMQSYGLNQIKVKDEDQSVELVQSPSNAGSPMPFYGSMPAPLSQTVPQQMTPGTQKNSADESKAKEASKEKYIEVRSPFVGTFYAASSPDSEPFASVGKKIKKGDTLCIVEAMKLMNEIEAERDGEIVEILIENEQPVEYDQVLFLMK